MFWIFCTVLVLCVAAAIFAPIWRARQSGTAAAMPAAAYDLQVYRDQLREVERDLERGVIAPEDADRLRTEIGRKVLDADRRQGDAAPSSRGGAGAGAALVLLALLAGAVALYLREGVPGAPDLPIASRIAMAERAYDTRPSQDQAEAQATAPADLPDPDPEYMALVEQLRAAVARNPDDPQGLTLLATSEMRLGNITAAREAQQRLVAARGDAASAEEVMRLAALMIEAAGGIITPEAEQVLARSLGKDPNQPQARYLLGLLQLQNGRPDRAFPIWRRLIEEGPTDAPWIAPIRNGIQDLAWLAGQPDYVPPEPSTPGMPSLPGPDAGMLDAAEDMSPEQRQEMIGGMVARLEARLADQGGTPEEWARLISSLGVLGQTDHARDIWAEAQTRFAASPEALQTVRAAAQAAGLVE